MFKELLQILRGDEPLAGVRKDFQKMFGLALENTLQAGEVYFGRTPTPDERSRIYDKDIKINQLERAIRKRLVAHLSLPGNQVAVPYGLLMMSVIKDVERLGDYAKNLTQVSELGAGPLPDDENVGELREIRREIEQAFRATAEIFDTADHARALDLIRSGRDLAHRCDALVGSIAKTQYETNVAVVLGLGTRFYKRIGGHVLNVLSSVVMPLHKIDYYDEDEATAPGLRMVSPSSRSAPSGK